VSTDILEADAL